MSEQAQEQAPTNGTPPPAPVENRESFTEAWKRAERIAEARERGEDPLPEEPAEAAPETPEAEAKPDNKPEPTKADKPEDGEGDENEGKVSVAERRKFRQQKREAFEKVAAERARLAQEREAAERYYAPLLEAQQLFEAGDIDGAMKKAFGLDISEANKRVLKREANKDPRVDKLEREAAELRRQVQAREEAERRAYEQRVSAQKRQEWLADQSAELEQHEDLAPFAKNEWLLDGIYHVQEEHWDGHETLSAAEAAAEYLERLRNDAQARQAFEALSRVFGNQGAAIPEGAKAPAVRGSKASPARPGGKAPPKSFSQRSAAEASAPDRIAPDDPQRDIKLRNKFAAMLEQSSPE